MQFSSVMFILNFENKVVKTWNWSQQEVEAGLERVGQWEPPTFSELHLQRQISSGYWAKWIISKNNSMYEKVNVLLRSADVLRISFNWVWFRWTVRRASSWMMARRHTSCWGNTSAASRLRAVGRRRAASCTFYCWMERKSNLQHHSDGAGGWSRAELSERLCEWGFCILWTEKQADSNTTGCASWWRIRTFGFLLVLITNLENSLQISSCLCS